MFYIRNFKKLSEVFGVIKSLIINCFWSDIVLCLLKKNFIELLLVR
jgi:hypothetical protein